MASRVFFSTRLFLKLAPLLLFVAVPLAAAQAQRPIQQTYVTVVNGRTPVLGLSPADVVLRDGGVRQQILDIQQATAPLAIAIVAAGFDVADRPAVTRAIEDVVRTVTADNQDGQVGVLTGGPATRQVTMLTLMHPQADAALEQAEAGGDVIAILADACAALRAAATDRRVLLLLLKRQAGDNDVVETHRLTDAIYRGRVALWTVEVGPAPARGAKETGLNEALTASTQMGGALRGVAASAAAVGPVTAGIVTLLRSQSVVSYTWPDPMLSVVSITTRHERGDVLQPIWPR